MLSTPPGQRELAGSTPRLGRVLAANTDLAFEPAARERARRAVKLGIEAVLALLLLGGSAGGVFVLRGQSEPATPAEARPQTVRPTAVAVSTRPPTATSPRAATSPSAATSPAAAIGPAVGAPLDAPQGNAIVAGGCFGVGARQCLTADPRLEQAIAILRTTTKGAPLLRTAAEAGVMVRVGAVGHKSLGVFRPSSKTVTLALDVADASPRGQAAVLAHELRHVSDWSHAGSLFMNNTLNCYGTEVNAFQTEAAVWDELKVDGPPEDSVEAEVDDIAFQIDSGNLDFWLWVGKDYHAQCA